MPALLDSAEICAVPLQVCGTIAEFEALCTSLPECHGYTMEDGNLDAEQRLRGLVQSLKRGPAPTELELRQRRIRGSVNEAASVNGALKLRRRTEL